MLGIVLTASGRISHLMAVVGAFAGIGGVVAIVDGLRAFAQYRRTEIADGVVTNRWKRTTWDIAVKSSAMGVDEPGGRRTTYPCTVYFVAADGREVHARVPEGDEKAVTQAQQPIEVSHDRDRPVEFTLERLGRKHKRNLAAQIAGGCIAVLVGVEAFTAFELPRFTFTF